MLFYIDQQVDMITQWLVENFLNKSLFYIPNIDPLTLNFILYIKAKSTSSSSLLKYSSSFFRLDHQLPAHLSSCYREHSTYHRVIRYVMVLLSFRNSIITSLSPSLLFHEKLFFVFPSECPWHYSLILKFKWENEIKKKWRWCLSLLSFVSSNLIRKERRITISNVSPFFFSYWTNITYQRIMFSTTHINKWMFKWVAATKV